MNNFLKMKRGHQQLLKSNLNTQEKINLDASLYKELKNVKRISPGGYLIDKSIFNHGQKNAYDEYKRYTCYYNNEGRGIHCKAMVKQWLETNTWFFIRGHSSECKNKNLSDWEIKQFVERVEKFYLTDGRRKNGFRTCKNEKKYEKPNSLRRIRKEVDYEVEEDHSENQEDESVQDELNNRDPRGKLVSSSNNRNLKNITEKNNNIKERSFYDEASLNLIDQINSKDGEIKMLKLTIEKLLKKIEEERCVKEKFKEIIVSMGSQISELLDKNQNENKNEVSKTQIAESK